MTKKTHAQKKKEQAELKEKAGAFVDEFTTKFNALTAEYLDYRDGVLLAAHNKAGELIGNAITLAEEIGQSRVRSIALNLVLEKKKILINGSPSILTKIVRAICGKDSKRASILARVAEVAKKEGIAPSDIPNWIKKQGGLEEIRMSKSQSGAPRSELRALGQTIINSSDAVASFDRCSVTPKQAGETLFLGFTDNDGHTELFASLQGKSLENAFYEQLGRQRWASSKEDAKSKDVSDLIHEIVDGTKAEEKVA